MIVNGLFRAIEWLLIGLLGLMVVLVFGNVVLRYGFNSGIVASDELSRFIFVWLTLLGALVALRERAHLGMSSFIASLGIPGRRVVRFVSDALIFLCCVLLAHGAWKQTVIALDDHAPVTGLSMAWVVGVLVVAGAGMALLVGHDLWRQLRGTFPADELVHQPNGTAVE